MIPVNDGLDHFDAQPLGGAPDAPRDLAPIRDEQAPNRPSCGRRLTVNRRRFPGAESV
jgi:hypothetical protein